MSEFKTIARHAGTVLVGQLAVMSFGVADTVIAGRYSPQALAVLSLASSIYISIYVALNGLLQALLPVWSELHGAGKTRELGRSFRQALYITALATLTGMAGLWFPDPWLSWTQVPLELWPDVRSYLRILAIALVPSLLFRMYSTLNQSLGLPRLVTWLQAGALWVKIPLSLVFTFGLGPWPGLGVVGCAWATLVVNSLMMLTGLWLLRTQDIYQPYGLWQRIEVPQWPLLKRYLQLGIPAGLTVMVEVTSFTMMALFVARLGAVASAGHQIAASLASVLYMVPLALGIASSARTGYWLGAQQAGKARRATYLGLGLTVGAALVCAGALLAGRDAIAHAFTTDPVVAQTATVWLGWVALYHLADAVQATSVFLLRCYRITVAPLVIYTALLWGAGLMGGYLWAYQDSALGLSWTPRPSVDTFWITSTMALATVSVLFGGLVWRVARAPHRPM
ncbi:MULTISPECIES: MATE family efflux transporter [unclassified Limnohabitans]|uniref:MATE family efflux transporter n=1 Tax=unclassified Limnohabitans TaxID=2626134 RepID=UPI000AA1C833|nr:MULTISPECIES: MATE family efflux transporter [unclassified Limnohabitans]PUE20235.1 MATE family efflux transporter [Limnohabitans sp. WS1]